jgi:hypothetical protein
MHIWSIQKYVHCDIVQNAKRKSGYCKTHVFKVHKYGECQLNLEYQSHKFKEKKSK